ncbi:MAG: DUF6266 family protein [Bacteroides sp.]|nr:DUF6266 family protein [Ruminococcus flavefaciens]MCM1554302.1 DUF6266 family protein [Bacteroides sp.]
MGTIKQGILGGFKGKVGKVVGSSWKGIPYMKALPANVHNPRTPAQTAHRTKFATAMRFLKHFTPIIKQSYTPPKKGQTPFNAAFSDLLRNATTCKDGNVNIDYSKVNLTRGNFPPLDAIGCHLLHYSFGSKVAISWTTPEQDSPRKDDKISVVVYHIPSGQTATAIKAITREASNLGVAIPDDWKKDEIRVWAYVCDAEEKQYSTLTYATKINETHIS